MRAGEIVRLRLHDVDFDSNQVYVRHETSKGKRDRWVGFDEGLKFALLAYLPYRLAWVERRNTKAQTLFVTYGGKVGSGKPMGTQSLNLLLRRLCRDAGIQTRKFHALRHTAAVMASRHLPLPIVQKQLGHRDLSTTQVYLRLRPDEVVSAFKDANLSSHFNGQPKEDD